MLTLLQYDFTEEFPYFESVSPDGVDYEKFRQKFIFPTSPNLGPRKWLEDKELNYMLDVELRMYF